MNFEEFMAMKKFYIQPETDLLSVAPAGNIALTSNFVDNNATDGMRDDAPKRKLSVLYI